MRRWIYGMFLGAALTTAPLAHAQNGPGTVIFTSRRPPREISGNIRSWAQSNSVRAVTEDTTSHLWRIQFMAFLSRAPNSAEVTLVFYHVERNNTRRYISNESVSLSNPTDRIFYHNTVLHRAAGEFEPMENYEVAITVTDARGPHEIARGRIGLVGQVERHDGVVDFTGSNGPQVH